MKIVIELDPAQSALLQSIATSLGVDVHELAKVAVTDLAGARMSDFEAAASRVLLQNHELYQRLAK